MADAPVRVGVVGVGSIGRHHARILSELDGVEFLGAYDTDAARANRVLEQFGGRAYGTLEALLADADAVSVAVPTPQHAEVGEACLTSGCDVMMEKPLATTLAEADRLIAVAEEHDRVLQVGHVERYNPAVEAVLGRIERPRFIEIHRLGTFVERSLEVDVIADLMIHDIDIVHALVDGDVREIRAVGVPVLSDEIDIANARLELEGGCIVNMTASRVSMNRVRKVRIFQPRAYFSVDYSDQTVACFRLEEGGDERATISGDPVPVTRGEPLVAELRDFVDSVRLRRPPRVDGSAGRRALATALRVRQALELPGESQLAPGPS